jgi:tetratricopeptide (TPR) repeat protein
MKRNWLILLALAAIITVPPIATGYRYLEQAETSISGSESSRYYESAAKILFWQPELYEKAGLKAGISGDQARAIEMLTLARQKGVLSPNGQLYLGDVYLLSGAVDNAIAEWESLLSEGQETASVCPRLMKEYHTQGRYDAEERVLRKWLDFDPINPEANERLGLLLTANDTPEALPLLERAAADSPEAAARLEELLSALQQADVPATYRLTLSGRALANLGEWALARHAFEHATQVDPTYAPAWAWLGLARQRTGIAGAQEALEKALALDSSSALIHAMLGLYLESRGEFAQAEAQYTTATKLEPENPAWWQALGRVVAQRDLVTALEHYLRATELAPQDPETWYAMAVFCIENEAFVQDYGLDAALRAYALKPGNLQYMDTLGRALAASGESDSAEALFLKAITTAPQDAAPVFHLGLLYLQTNRGAEAKARFQEAVQLDPDGPYGTQAKKALERYFP